MKEFFSTRATLTRLSDDSEWHGWVVPAPAKQLLIKLDHLDGLHKGDKFCIELTSIHRTSKFESEYLGQKEGESVFKLPNVMRKDPPKEAARRRPDDVKASLRKGSTDEAVELIDIAPRGLGILHSESFTDGTELTIKVASPFGGIELGCAVVYSQPDHDHEGQIRTGLSIKYISRLDQARWHQLLANQFSDAA